MAFAPVLVCFFLAACLAAQGDAEGPLTTIPLWAHGSPEGPPPAASEHDTTKPSDALIARKRVERLTDVTTPTLSVYEPASPSGVHAAVLVFPGGGYRVLAYDLEGTEVCSWLNSIGMACVLVKYRVPTDKRFPEGTIDLEDAQQAMRLTREHAREWHIDPARVGALGFSAGGHLAAVLSIHADLHAPGGSASDASVSARPDFVVIVYPGYLRDEAHPTHVSAGVEPTATTPPTFLVQAEDDPVHVENAILYFQALKDAKVPAELHLFANGGHGYGLRPTELPVTHWPALAETWFHTIHVLKSASGSK